ncbi:MAG: hypothetical protein ABF242_08805 [Flavobacteriales bacterium]
MIKAILYSFLLSSFCMLESNFGNDMELINPNFLQEKTNPLTFEKDIKPIMNSYCGGIFCHHGKPSIWTKYETVKIAIENGSFKREVIDKKSMPKRKKLPEAKYQIIKKWLEQGALQK